MSSRYVRDQGWARKSGISFFCPLCPKLGVNLLSGRRMCEKGLIGSFDQHGLKMHDKQGKEIMEARQRGGVYIVEK